MSFFKTAHRRSGFLKKLVSQEILVSIDLMKKSALKFPEFWKRKLLHEFMQKNC